MSPRLIARPLAGFLLFFTLSLFVPLAVACFEMATAARDAFAVTLAVGLSGGGLMWLFGSGQRRDLYRREGLLVVGFAWLMAGALAGLPFWLAGVVPTLADAFFEAVSGLTTTGATVLGSPGIDKISAMPTSILLWRSQLQWMGGIGIILVFIVLLPGMGVTGSRLIASEQIGVDDERRRPRMGDRGRRLLVLYVVLTVAAMLAYRLAGMSSFDAMCHSMTTLATGGFSTQDASIGHYQSLGIELVAIVFMFLAGSNFLLMVRVLVRGGADKSPSLLQRSEFRAYLGITLVVALAMSLSLWYWGEHVVDPALGVTHDYGGYWVCLRHALFQTVSILTSTGYATANFEVWAKPTLFLLLLCMLVGGSTGSTAGGFKVLRLLVCVKLVGHTLRQFVRPRSVETLRVGSDVIPEHTVSAILALLILWLGAVGAGTLVLVVDSRLDLLAAFSASLSMTSCVGPAISEVDVSGTLLAGSVDLGPYSAFGELHPLAKLFMALQMILGRLEILAPLALLTPGLWRK